MRLELTRVGLLVQLARCHVSGSENTVVCGTSDLKRLQSKVHMLTFCIYKSLHSIKTSGPVVLYFDLRPGPKILFQGNTPEGSDTFQWPVIERDRVGGLRLMIWDKVKVPLCHYSHAPEESNL